MTTLIPPRLARVEDKDVRFYVAAPASVKLAITEEALARGTDLWTLGGAVLAHWVSLGCPDCLPAPSQSSSPAPSPSSSVAGQKEPGA